MQCAYPNDTSTNQPFLATAIRSSGFHPRCSIPTSLKGLRTLPTELLRRTASLRSHCRRIGSKDGTLRPPSYRRPCMEGLSPLAWSFHNQVDDPALSDGSFYSCITTTFTDFFRSTLGFCFGRVGSGKDVFTPIYRERFTEHTSGLSGVTHYTAFFAAFSGAVRMLPPAVLTRISKERMIRMRLWTFCPPRKLGDLMSKVPLFILGGVSAS